MAPLDELLIAAVETAARTVSPEPGDTSFLERRLADTVGASLADELVSERVLLDRKLPDFEIPGWDPQPGWLDLAVLDDENQPIAVGEMKIDDVDQTLWDIFKVASATEHDTVEAAYIIAAARHRTWASDDPVVELFRDSEPEQWYSRYFFEEYAKTWATLLRGGRGRPTRLPRLITITPLTTAHVSNFPPYELRLIRIAPDPFAEPFSLIDGWPANNTDPREIPDDNLTPAHLPDRNAPEQHLHEFALTTSGYERMGTFGRCGDLANRTIEDWRVNQPLPASLRELRCCLFFEQRRWHHYGDPFSEETTRYIHDLIAAMRQALASR